MINFKTFLKEQNQTTTEEDPFEGNETVKKLYGSLATAEHSLSSKDDPYSFNPKTYIRTKYDRNSTAYGPVQITYKTAKGFYDKNKNLFTGNEPYTQQFLQQGSKFLKAKKGDKQYDVGCVGDLCNQKYNTQYQKMASSVIKGKMKEAGLDPTKPIDQAGVEKFMDHWRYGLGSKKSTKALDKRYYDAFMGAYNR
jgi:hypothetical protein